MNIFKLRMMIDQISSRGNCGFGCQFLVVMPFNDESFGYMCY